jgi:hypothetical protein
MRVKISYGVDIKDVPNTVRDLIHNSLDEIKASAEMLRRALDDLDDCEKNASYVLRSIDQSRIRLGSVDLTLKDAHSIVSGLDSYYNGEQDVSDRRPTMDSGGDSITQTKDNGEG